jgi:hypothetical protein
MRTGLRPYITAGVALVGASAVAVTSPTRIRWPKIPTSTNQDVTADDRAKNLSDGDKHAPRLFGRHAADRTGNSAAAGPVGEGIHDGIQGFRDGVRDAVKTLTGHANDNSKSTSGDTGASS